MTKFKINILFVTKYTVRFELLTSRKPRKLSLPLEDFPSFALGLNARVFTRKTEFTDEQLKILWNLRVLIYTSAEENNHQPLFATLPVLERLPSLSL